MYKSFKIFSLILLVISMCTYITYSVEPKDSESQPKNPPVQEVATEPSPSIIPAPDTNTEAIYSAAEQQSSVQSAEAIEAASLFSNSIDELVMKRVDSFYKNGGKGTIGIYIKEMKSGFEYAYNAEKTNPEDPNEGYFNSASTCKLLSAAVIYHLNAIGELELDKTYTDSITKSKYNFKQLLPKMISHSVNDYFNITLRHLGSEHINETLRKLGLKHSMVYSEIMPAEGTSVGTNRKRYGISRSPRTTPRDLGVVLELLYNGKTFGVENDKLFMQSLLDNIYSNRLPAGVGYKSPVAHKTGTSGGEGVYNDAGIILLDDNPYIMVVMSKGSGSNVQALYRTIIGEVYGFMKKRSEDSP